VFGELRKHWSFTSVLNICVFYFFYIFPYNAINSHLYEYVIRKCSSMFPNRTYIRKTPFPCAYRHWRHAQGYDWLRSAEMTIRAYVGSSEQMAQFQWLVRVPRYGCIALVWAARLVCHCNDLTTRANRFWSDYSVAATSLNDIRLCSKHCTHYENVNYFRVFVTCNNSRFSKVFFLVILILSTLI
jgi:hypothetical protein